MSRLLRDLIGEVNMDLDQQICDGLNCLDGVLWFLPSCPSTPFGLPDHTPGLGTEDRTVWGLPWRAASLVPWPLRQGRRGWARGTGESGRAACAGAFCTC